MRDGDGDDDGDGIVVGDGVGLSVEGAGVKIGGVLDVGSGVGKLVARPVAGVKANVQVDKVNLPSCHVELCVAASRAV